MSLKRLRLGAVLFVVACCSVSCNVPTMPGWTLVFDDEFGEAQTTDLFGTAGQWYSLGDEGWNPDGWGNTYWPPVPAWTNVPAGCSQPALNTALTGAGTVALTTREQPGSFAVWDFPSGQLTCKQYNYTGSIIFSKQRFRFGYFEIRAKIPNQGKYGWPAFWLYASDGAYREVDVFEFNDSNPHKMGMNEHLAKSIDGGTLPQTNDYPLVYDIPPSVDITNTFHTYAVKWTPNSLTWYFDGQAVRTLAGHVPHLNMNIIADIAVPSWRTPPGGTLPLTYEIDYIRAYRSQNNEFMFQWGDGSGQIGSWVENVNDRYLSGHFLSSSSKAQLLALRPGAGAQFMSYNGSAWPSQWSNGNNGKINWWVINGNDRYVVGDFAGLGRDQILAVNSSSLSAHLMDYNSGASAWETPWGNNGNGKIDWWSIGAADKFLAGDFDGSGTTQLLAISASGYAHLMKYNAGSWNTIWANSGNGWIGSWHLDGGGADKFVSGKFAGDGRSMLLAVATNAYGYAGLLKYSGGAWQAVWNNGGSTKIHWWNMVPSDSYFAGNLDGGPQDQLLAISANGWAHLMSFSGSDWDTPWGNDGANTIDLWHMNPADRYVVGEFNAAGRADLFAVSTTGWSQLMHRVLP